MIVGKALLVVVMIVVASCGSRSEEAPVDVAERSAVTATTAPSRINGNVRIVPKVVCRDVAAPEPSAAPCPSDPPKPGTVVRIGDHEATVSVNGDFAMKRPAHGTHQVVVREPGGRSVTGAMTVKPGSGTLLIKVQEDFSFLDSSAPGA